MLAFIVSGLLLQASSLFLMLFSLPLSVSQVLCRDGADSFQAGSVYIIDPTAATGLRGQLHAIQQMQWVHV